MSAIDRASRRIAKALALSGPEVEPPARLRARILPSAAAESGAWLDRDASRLTSGEGFARERDRRRGARVDPSGRNPTGRR